MKIELVKGTASVRADEYFGPGERVIMVDGIRWGRTFAQSMSRYGMKYTFGQEHGGMIYDKDDDQREKWEKPVNVRISRRERTNADTRSTDQILVDKIAELIAAGRLIAPNIKKAKNLAAHEAFRQEQRAAHAARDKAFRAKALEALHLSAATAESFNAVQIMVDKNTVDRIVAAMRWAQEQ